MKLTIAQINTTAGDFNGNTDRIIRAIEIARSEGSQLVAFPEAAIQGYTSADWFLVPDVINAALAPLDRIVQATAGITAVIGTLRPTGLAVGKKLYNSAAVIHDRKLLGFADKTLLPSYEVFDEPRYFEPARGCSVFDIGELRLGVAVCEDFWNDETFWTDRLYSNDPTDELLKQGANLIVSVNASPFHRAKPAVRRRMVQHRARSSGVPMLFLNLVGANDGSIFDGSSMVSDSQGEIVLRAPAFEEFIGTVDTDSGTADERAIPDGEEAIARALVLGIRDFTAKAGFERAVVPMSGDLSSRVVAVLTVKALGAANVAVTLPSNTLSDAEANALEAEVEQVGLKVERSIHRPTDNETRRLKLHCTSKTELALGLFSSGEGLAVLGDLFETEITALAGYLISSGDMPSTSANSGVTAGSWSVSRGISVQELEAILKTYLEENRSPGDIIAAGRDAHTVYEILNSVEAPLSEYKRRTVPTILAISRGAFGPARRRPITHQFYWPFYPK